VVVPFFRSRGGGGGGVFVRGTLRFAAYRRISKGLEKD